MTRSRPPRGVIDVHDPTRTNTRLDDRAPIEVLGAAAETAEFAAVVRAARQVASFQA